MKRNRGFTLIELLVAISILAIVAVLGWRGLDGIIRARTALTAQMEATRGMQLAFAQMQSDAEHIADAGLLQQRPFLQAQADSMAMVRTSYRENEAAQLQVVSYRLVDGVLLRRESAPTRDLVQLDMLWKTATSNADSTAPVALQSGVAAMAVEVWENNRWAAGGQPPAAASALSLPPTGLRVSLQVKGIEAVMSKSFLLGGL
ncbi:MAG: prepilin-type N-terminal cleavage/methylation domain-containing protein [Pseudomonadota bacterium]